MTLANAARCRLLHWHLKRQLTLGLRQRGKCRHPLSDTTLHCHMVLWSHERQCNAVCKPLCSLSTQRERPFTTTTPTNSKPMKAGEGSATAAGILSLHTKLACGNHFRLPIKYCLLSILKWLHYLLTSRRRGTFSPSSEQLTCSMGGPRKCNDSTWKSPHCC